jgi:CheY-like chemotaxis protein
MAKILVAEDNKLTRLSLGQFLRGKGYEIELAEDGTQAIALFNKDKFDLVISDVVMPNGTGWDLLDHVQSSDASTPVLFMTAYALSASSSQSNQPTELVFKPLVLTELLSKVENILASRKS